jgi:hypothetical protein
MAKTEAAKTNRNVFSVEFPIALRKKTRSIFSASLPEQNSKIPLHGIEKDRVKIVQRSGCQNG